jgi:EAL domain-containing protein (putative c-di-GMP-specific phosphodiesterase class I)
MLHDTHMDAPGITEALVSMSGQGLSAEQRMLAVRYCVGRFTAGHHGGKPGDDLSEIFRTMMAETQARAEALTETVAKSAFDFAYQPIVNLKSGALAHCEALVRFHSGSGAGETVGFAEALGISEPFDLAVAAKVIREVEKTPDTRVAFNLSARTIGDPMTFGLISGLLAQKRAMRSRVLIEVTETAQLTDLAKANAAIQSLREIGFQVGIDDFGAGAASLQYLHAMLVDFVKFDGGLVARIGASRREDKLLEGLVSLCSELGVETVAECLETEAQTTRAREMGFTLGQGHYFGKAMPEIAKNAPEQRVAKRKGVQVSWS